MSQAVPRLEQAPPERPAERARALFLSLPWWKRVVFCAAGLFMVLGLGLQAFALVLRGSSGGGGGAGALPGEGAAPLPGELSPAFLRMGFSFFVGFCAGYVFRTFFKVSVLATGLLALVFVGLAQSGLLQVDWMALEHHVEQFVAGVRIESQRLETLFTGSVPSAAMAGLGLLAGIKRQ